MTTSRSERTATSFDLFGTLVDAETPDNPADAIATELAARDIDIPPEWQEAYRTPQFDVPEGRESPLPKHVQAIVGGEQAVVAEAVLAAFDRSVRVREGATAAIETAADRGPVGILSNCSVPGLVGRTLARSPLDASVFDAVVVSVDCGWRKPDERAFEAVAAELGCPVSALIHIGDDPETDGGARAAGARVILTESDSLNTISEQINEG